MAQPSRFKPDWRKILLALGATALILVAVIGGCSYLQSRPPVPAATEQPAVVEETMTVDQQVKSTVEALTAGAQTPQGVALETATAEVVDTATAVVFPLTGQVYPGQVFTGTTVTTALAAEITQYYVAEWTPDGRLWQPLLRELSNDRKVAHSVAIQLVAGRYEFNGVACKFWLDAERNGKGAGNPMTADHENGRQFTVEPAPMDGTAVAWGLVSCDGGPSTGFDIQYLGPLP